MNDPGFTNLSDFHKRFPDEQACRDYLERYRWNGHITCPHCESDRVMRFSNGIHYKCHVCRRKFTVKVGTIFEDSPLPLYKWFLASYILTAHKKGISSVQLAKDVGVTQKTAWFMLGRLRYAMANKSFLAPLGGVVEADETYVGGKPRKKEAPRKRGRTTDKKVPVLAVVERDGELRSMPVTDVKGETIGKFLKENVDPSATLFTDEFVSYKPVGKMFAAHESVNHAQDEYVRRGVDGAPDVHTNTIEGAFSHFKRMIVGTYHHISPEHTHRYTAESDYRYNTRKMKDVDRFVHTLRRVEDRLTYKELIADGTRVQRIKRAIEEAERQQGDGLPF